jgi:shikimate kinase
LKPGHASSRGEYDKAHRYPPRAGKQVIACVVESLGRLGAKFLDFIDVDVLIKNEHSESLPKILERLGQEQFKINEMEKILSLSNVTNTVIAPGGSVIYSDESMELLKKISTVVYLEIDAETLQYRVGDRNRGIVGLDKKSFAELYEDRMPLYKKWADITVDINHKNMNMILEEITNRVVVR